MKNRPNDSWNKLLSRMKQSAIEKCQGVSIMNVAIIMRDGRPVGWTEPQVRRYEGSVRNELLESLAEIFDMTGVDVV